MPRLRHLVRGTGSTVQASFNGISEPALCRWVQWIERDERRCTVGRGRCNCVVWGESGRAEPGATEP